MKAYFKTTRLTDNGCQVEFNEGDINIKIGDIFISFPEGYILDNKDAFQRLANFINHIFQDKGF